MDYQRWIVEKLIEKYERSKALKTGTFVQKISLNIQKDVELSAKLEDVEEKTNFLKSISILQNQNIVNYSWVKYEQGNLIDKIWLLPSEESIKACYCLLGRKSVKDKVSGLMTLIVTYQSKLTEGSVFYKFLGETLEILHEKQKIPRLLTEDFEVMEDILKCLVYMEHNRKEVLERVLSSDLYGNSKHFERKIRSKVLAVLRYIKKQYNDEVGDDEELLREMGIVKWPEIIEFTGSIDVTLINGNVIDYGNQYLGAYINSRTIEVITNIDMRKIQRVLFIENKANYVWYVENRKAVDELVVLHGGCYSPIKGKLFQKIYEAGEEINRNIQYYHWSDIDIGGFRIFTRLKNNIVPKLIAYQMDADTLLSHRNRAIIIEDRVYLLILEKMMMEITYEAFWPVIQEMLHYDIKLEQENLIIF